MYQCESFTSSLSLFPSFHCFLPFAFSVSSFDSISFILDPWETSLTITLLTFGCVFLISSQITWIKHHHVEACGTIERCELSRENTAFSVTIINGCLVQIIKICNPHVEDIPKQQQKEAVTVWICWRVKIKPPFHPYLLISTPCAVAVVVMIITIRI